MVGRRTSYKKLSEELLSQLKEKEKELAELKDRHLRLAAELENFKKRSQKRMAETLEMANQDLVSQLLPILDDLRRASHSKGKGLKRGITLIYHNLHSLLEKEGLKEIEATGKRFDPLYHQALLHMEDSQVPADHIAQELEKGYTFRGRVLRPTRVAVSKGGK